MSFRSTLKTNLKPFYCIFYGKRKYIWRITRFCCSVIFGSVCAFLICKCMLQPIFISRKYEHLILLITTPIVASVFMLTDAVKCITFLIFLSCFGKSGRSYFRALCFAFVISGPIANLSANTGEIIRSFSCSKILALNLTSTRFDLLAKPFQNVLTHANENVRDIERTFNQFGNVTKYLHKEILIDADNHQISRAKSSSAGSQELNVEYVVNQYQNRFKNRCLQQLNRGKIRCLKTFSSIHSKCYNKLPFILRTLVCWPFKVTFLCKINILGNPEEICNPSEVVPENFGESYFDLVAVESELNDGSSNVKVNYTILSSDTVPGAKTIEEITKHITTEFKIRRRVFDSIFKKLHAILGFVILKIVYVCIKYHRNYKADLQHDNIYITNYFKRVDRRRKSQNQLSLLPLKKYERIHLLDENHSRWHTQDESQAVTFHLLEFSLEIVTCCFFILIDYVLVSILLTIRQNSKTTFIQEGEHTIEFQVHGSGLIARLLKSTIGNFDVHETVSAYSTNLSCLPIPTILPLSFFLKLAALYFSVLVLIYQSSRLLRLRPPICGYFYRRREKKRILYMYNRLLKQRRTIRKTMMKGAKYNFASRQLRLKANLFLKIRLQWPQYFNWLVKFHVGRRKCVVCGELEDSKFACCRNLFCQVCYCSECFYDMENFCWICNGTLAVDILLNFNDLFKDF